MKLDKLIVHRLPGIPRGFVVETKATVGLIIGPNGSGKSSLCRAVRHLLWTDEATGSPFAVEGFFQWDQAQWKAVREEGAKTQWFRDGEAVDAPSLPGNHVARCYELGILDLVLPAGGEVEQKLAAVINQEMSGGVNLARISDDLFSLGAKLPAKRSTELQNATNHLATLVRNRKQLSEKENELVDKERDLKQTEKAVAKLALLEILKSRNKVAADLQDARLVAESFAEGQGRVHSGDADSLATMIEQRQKKDLEARRLDLEIETGRKTLESKNYPKDAAVPGLLTRQLAEATFLQTELHKLQEDLAGQEKVLAEILNSLDPSRDDNAAGPNPGRTVYTDLFETYSKLVRQQSRAEGLQNLLDQMDLLDLTDPATDDITRETLQRWLEMPEPQNGWIPWLGLLLGLAVLALGFGQDFGHDFGQSTVFWALGAGISVFSLWQIVKAWRFNHAHSRVTGELARQLEKGGLKLPGQVTRASILQLLLDETNNSIAKRTRGLLQDFLSGKQQTATMQTESCADGIRELRNQHGLALDRETHELIHLMNAIPAYRETRNGTAQLRAKIEHKEQALESLLDGLGSGFNKLGQEQPSSVLEAGALLEIMESNLQDFRDLQRTQQQNQKDLDRAQQDRDALDENLSTFWNKLGLPPQGDDHLVQKLVENLPQWQEAQEEQNRLQHEFDGLDRRFREKPELLDPTEALTFTPEIVERNLQELHDQGRSRNDLRDEISLIRVQVKQARESLEVAEAQDRVETARDALGQIRQQHREAALGRLLLKDVEQTYHHASRPKVLATASDNFLEFTQGSYQLRVVPGTNNAGRFAAYDTGLAENVGLAQLSDGTRAQLLLAVRLAFIAENEGSVKPPIFLDESLTSSDPQRFAAIADRLARWAGHQERQIFYLSSNPNDARAWETALEKSGLPLPHVFDLGRARSGGTSGPIQYTYEASASFPEPGDRSPEEYARLLAVPALDPWQPGTDAHLWYLLNDDLPLLHRLLTAATPSLGRWLAKKSSMGTFGSMTSQMIANLEARGHCLDAFLKNWRTGRGRPVTAGTLEDSGHVGEKFGPKCRILLKEVGGDAGEFLAGLRGKKVSRFQTKNIDLLEKFFMRENFRDPREALSTEDLVGHVMTIVESEIKAGDLSTSEVRKLVRNWLQATLGEPKSC